MLLAKPQQKLYVRLCSQPYRARYARSPAHPSLKPYPIQMGIWTADAILHIL